MPYRFPASRDDAEKREVTTNRVDQDTALLCPRGAHFQVVPVPITMVALCRSLLLDPTQVIIEAPMSGENLCQPEGQATPRRVHPLG